MDYAIVSPSFDEIKIQLSDKYYSGKQLFISKNTKKTSTLNGKTIGGNFVTHQQLVKGAKLSLSSN
jgi:putative alpha-1,2-mannosidase